MADADLIPEGRGAYLSTGGTSRYTLTRRWSDGPRVVFVGLNPSTADADLDDATSRRWESFARREGYGGYIAVNLYAFRATDPRELRTARDPVGPENDHVLGVALAAHDVVLCWGACAAARGITPSLGSRAMVVEHRARRLAGRVGVFGLTAGGQPKHPLYLRSDAPIAWRDRG